MHQRAGRRQEVAVGVLGIEADLDGMAVDAKLILRQRQPAAGRDHELPFDQVLAGDRLGHRMLDLQAGVHLHEVEGAVLVGDELDGARALVADRLGGGDGGLAHRLAPRRVHVGRRRLLDHLLVAALDRAVALEQVEAVAVAVGEDLDLDVARPRQVLLDQHVVVGERGLGLALGAGQGVGELRRLLDHAHALAAAAGRGLDQHGEADALGLLGQQRRATGRRRDSPAPAAPWPFP